MTGMIILFIGGTVLPGMTQAWEDDFDDYTLDQFLDGGPDDGGWKGWDNDPTYGAYVVDDEFYSDPHSVEVAGTTDLVHEYEGVTSGLWTYTAWQFIPETFSGNTYFILLSLYEDGLGQDNKWAVQIRFDSVNQVAECEYDVVNLPLITGRWVELRTEIDLDNDWFQFFYDGELLHEKNWTATPNNNNEGYLEVSAVDLFGNNASPVYYDEMSLTERVEFVVDNEDPGFLVYKGSAWPTRNYPDAYNGNTAYSAPGNGGNIVAWRVDNIVAPGNYDVYVYKFDHPLSRFMATDAQYRVKYAGGLSGWIYVDQSTAGDEWILLGNFFFNDIGGQGIGLTDNADGYIIADAVKLVLTE
jgi:hypothetical protein